MSQKPLARKYSAFLVLGFTGVVALLWLTRPEPQLDLAAERRMQVDVVEVVSESFQPQRQLSGTLQPVQRAQLRFEVDGVLAQQFVEPGQAVTVGEMLLKLHDADYADSAREANARLQQERLAITRDRTLLKLAQENVALQQQEVARQDKLGNASLASGSSRDAAHRQLLQLQAEAARLQHSIDSADARLAIQHAAANRAQRNLERTQLRAPFAGVVNSIGVEVGDFVAARDVALEVVDVSQLEFYGELDGEAAAQLSLGQAVALQSGEGKYQATIIALQPVAKANTATHALHARLDNPGLLAGSLATITLPLTLIASAHMVPAEAVVRADGETFVFVVSDKILQRRNVVLGPREGGQQVVLEGVQAGEIIIARDGAALMDGQVVEY